MFTMIQTCHDQKHTIDSSKQNHLLFFSSASLLFVFVDSLVLVLFVLPVPVRHVQNNPNWNGWQ